MPDDLESRVQHLEQQVERMITQLLQLHALAHQWVGARQVWGWLGGALLGMSVSVLLDLADKLALLFD